MNELEKYLKDKPHLLEINQDLLQPVRERPRKESGDKKDKVELEPHVRQALEGADRDIHMGTRACWEYSPETTTIVAMISDGRLVLEKLVDATPFVPEPHMANLHRKFLLTWDMVERNLISFCKREEDGKFSWLRYDNDREDKYRDEIYELFGDWFVEDKDEFIGRLMVGDWGDKVSVPEKAFANILSDDEGVLGFAFEPFEIRMVGQSYTPDFIAWTNDYMTTVYEVKGKRKLKSDSRARVKFALTASELAGDWLKFLWAKQNDTGWFDIGPIRMQEKRKTSYWLR